MSWIHFAPIFSFHALVFSSLLVLTSRYLLTMAPRTFTDDEMRFIVEQNARNPNLCDIRRNLPFDSELPSRNGIRNTLKKWKENGSIHRRKKTQPKSILTPANINNVREIIENDPKKSTRRVALESGISRGSVMRALKFLDMRPYRPTMVQELKPEDFQRRSLFPSFSFSLPSFLFLIF